MCDKMAISAYILKIVEKDPILRLQMGKNFEVTFDIFSVLVFQISVLESYLDIYLF